MNLIPLDDGNYELLNPVTYFSPRYHKVVTAPAGIYDGATGAMDIISESWVIHDELKKTKRWSDYSECTNLQASWVIYDILKKEGYWFRARSWFIGTLLWGTFNK